VSVFGGWGADRCIWVCLTLHRLHHTNLDASTLLYSPCKCPFCFALLCLAILTKKAYHMSHLHHVHHVCVMSVLQARCDS
jgi:hypothetical protein